MPILDGQVHRDPRVTSCLHLWQEAAPAPGAMPCDVDKHTCGYLPLPFPDFLPFSPLSISDPPVSWLVSLCRASSWYELPELAPGCLSQGRKSPSRATRLGTGSSSSGPILITTVTVLLMVAVSPLSGLCRIAVSTEESSAART